MTNAENIGIVCPFECENKTEYGYCKTTARIKYQQMNVRTDVRSEGKEDAEP